MQAYGKSYYVNENGKLSIAASAGLTQGDLSSAGSISLISAAAPEAGSLSVGADGAFDYTPNPGTVGIDSFSFVVSDGETTATETAQLTIGAATLQLEDDAYALPAGGGLTLGADAGLLANDLSSAGPVWLVSASPPSYGTLGVAPDGGFSYNAINNAADDDLFEYTATNGAATATATVSVRLVAPLLSINDDHYALGDAASLTVAAADGLLANDFASAGSLTAALVAGPAHGGVTVNADGGFVYTPDAGFAGSDTFTYSADNGAGFSAVATATILGGSFAVSGENYVETAPALSLPAARGLLAQAYSRFGGLSLISTGAAAHGTFTADADGAFQYTSDPGFFGDDAATYTVADAAGNTAVATAYFAVADRAPTTGTLAYAVHGPTVAFDAAAGLLHALSGYAEQETVRAYDAPAHGALVVNPDGSFVYSPNPGYVGPDSISFVAADAFDVAVTQTATLDVSGQAPIALRDDYAVSAGGSLVADAAAGLLANDADPDGDTLTLTANGQPAHGSLTVQPDGAFSYKPDSGYVGEDNFLYTITDSTGATASATAHIDVVDFAVVCFARGARLATARGEVEVERLRVGDLMRTAGGGLRPVVWLGHRRLEARRHPRPQEVWPVLISAGAFAPGLPRRDLLVSPRHALAIGEAALAPAVALANGATIRQVEVETIEYWHVELESHDLLIAEGLAAESYLETGSRAFFVENDVVGLGLSPDGPRADFCRPMHEDGPELETTRARLLARAEALGWRRETGDGLHLVAEGVRIEPARCGDDALFTLPAQARELWLCARAARPCDVGESADIRALGVAVHGLAWLDAAGAAREISLDDEALGPGFFEREEAGHRWTGARARLDAQALGASGGGMLRVRLGPPLPRWAAPASAAAG